MYPYFNIEIGSPIYYSLPCSWLPADENNPSFTYMNVQCHSSQHNIIPHIFHFLSYYFGKKGHRICIYMMHTYRQGSWSYTVRNTASRNGLCTKVFNNLYTRISNFQHCIVSICMHMYSLNSQNKKAISFIVHISIVMRGIRLNIVLVIFIPLNFMYVELECSSSNS